MSKDGISFWKGTESGQICMNNYTVYNTASMAFIIFLSFLDMCLFWLRMQKKFKNKNIWRKIPEILNGSNFQFPCMSNLISKILFVCYDVFCEFYFSMIYLLLLLNFFCSKFVLYAPQCERTQHTHTHTSSIFSQLNYFWASFIFAGATAVYFMYDGDDDGSLYFPIEFYGKYGVHKYLFIKGNGECRFFYLSTRSAEHMQYA